ncbi:hypothetical protein [Mucilaginibacter sp. CSA2-8R]|uniref:hypothetical protein n=1 Tax=Mucilaginibacter sp. CSA2-8R TaxID=3141542 RepID=UPI00315CAFCE
MAKQKNIQKEVQQLPRVVEKQINIDHKLDELLALLADIDIDNAKVRSVQQRLNQVLQKKTSYKQPLDAFKQINTADKVNRTELLDEFSVLLANHQVDTRMSKKYLMGERLSRFFLIIISLVLIVLGFAMIVMPAPPYFEMFTVFYFNIQDGITLMDLISLLIILSGIYLLVRSIYKPLRTT